MLELITDWSPLTRGVIAFAIAFGVSLLIGEKVILKLISLKLGQPVRSREEVNELFDLHGQKAGTPTMGGVMILGTLVLATLFAADLTNPFIHVCIFVLLGLGALGFKDDYAKVAQNNSKGVSSKFKLVWQFGVAAIAAAWIYYTPSMYPTPVQDLGPEEGVVAAMVNIFSYWSDFGMIFIPIVNTHVNIMWLAIPFFIVVIVGASNAVNLTDGLDGLASGCTITTGVTYMIIALASTTVFTTVEGVVHTPVSEVAVFSLAMVGAVAGFLWFNAFPAKMFMGDTGSLALGGAVGTIAICTRQEILLVLVGLVFVLEALSVMFQVSYFKYTRKTTGEGKRLLKCAPLHHHFELTGWKETTVITRFWIISVICAGLGLYIFTLSK